MNHYECDCLESGDQKIIALHNSFVKNFNDFDNGRPEQRPDFRPVQNENHFDQGDYISNVVPIQMYSQKFKEHVNVPVGAVGKVDRTEGAVIYFSNGDYVVNKPSNFKLVHPNWDKATDLLILTSPLSYLISYNKAVLSGESPINIVKAVVTPSKVIANTKEVAEKTVEVAKTTFDFLTGNWKLILAGVVVVIILLVVVKLR